MESAVGQPTGVRVVGNLINVEPRAERAGGGSGTSEKVETALERATIWPVA